MIIINSTHILAMFQNVTCESIFRVPCNNGPMSIGKLIIIILIMDFYRYLYLLILYILLFKFIIYIKIYVYDSNIIFVHCSIYVHCTYIKKFNMLNLFMKVTFLNFCSFFLY